MIEFVSIISIFLLLFIEIALTVLCVRKILAFELKINEAHVKMLESAKKALEINDEIQNSIKKINKIFKILSNKKLYQIKKLVMMTIDIIQVIILIKSFDFSKGAKKINYKLLKNIAYARIIQQIFKKFLDFAQNLCAI